MKTLKTLKTLIALLFVLITCGGAMLAAPPQCGGTSEVMAGLSARFGETNRWFGVLPNGQVLSITANPDGSTWTALGVQPDGTACILSSGESWAEGDMPLPPAGREG